MDFVLRATASRKKIKQECHGLCFERLPWLYLITNIIVHSRWVIDLSVRTKTIGHSEENKEIDLYDLGLGNGL